MIELLLSIRGIPTQSASRRGWPDAVLPSDDRLARALPCVLSGIAGATDVIGFLGLSGLFTAHVTGNLVILTARILAGSPAIFSHVLAVPVFMLVLLLTCLVAGVIERSGRSSLRPLLLLHFMMLAAFFGLSIAPGLLPNGNVTLPVVAGMFGVAAMAVQNALVQIGLRDTPSTAVMTTNVTRLMLEIGTVLVGRDATEIAKAKRRALRIFPVIVGFAIGCGLGAVGEATAGLWSLILPALLALIAYAMGAASTQLAGVRR